MMATMLTKEHRLGKTFENYSALEKKDRDALKLAMVFWSRNLIIVVKTSSVQHLGLIIVKVHVR